MRMLRSTFALAGLLLAVPALTFATPPQAASTATGAKTAQASKPAAAKPVATSAATGVIKSIDATSLVISKPSGKVKEMTFVLNQATQRKGDLAVGAAVEVRYHTEGAQQIASAVSAQPKKK